MSADDVQIRRLSPAEARERVDELAAVLHDAVDRGASIGFMAPFSPDDARAAFDAMLAEVDAGRRLVVAAFDGERVVGSVQVILAVPANQPHRGEITKLLVHGNARRRGIAQRLMEAAEAAARAEGKTLLVLDAVTGGDAARLYDRMGWTTVGVIPDYALYPDGRVCDTTVFYKRL